MNWLIEPFAEPFARQALVAGLLVVLATSVVGTWVVIRGMSFLGDALAHGVLPGVALALIFGFDPLIGAALSALVMIGGINLIHRRSRLAEDTAIGLLFVGMLAIGVIVISRTRSYSGDLTAILFGNLLGVTGRDLLVLAATGIASIILTFGFYRAFLALSFNREKAQMLGLRPGLAHAVMLGMVTLVVVASYRSVGSLLVFALLVAPPATASLTARRVPSMMAAALGYGAVAVLAGLIVSYWADTAASATVAGLAVVEFFAVMVLRRPTTR
ncbi:MAG: zinc ABC transporter permease AztB [Acidimicrobiia bacterium]|nr:zinc ABC transporter permease AztB [Acidimicrobiia bacterium]